VAGVVNVLLLAPVWMQIVHLLLAGLLWITLVLLCAATLKSQPAA
jgi:heme A synthase